MVSINIMNMLYGFIIITIVGMFYERFQRKYARENKIKENELIQKFLLNREKQSGRPIIWVYLDKRPNTRHWSTFNDRLSTSLNQPYLFLTIKSIIEQAGDDYDVCLIDASSFEQMLPNWTINISTVSEPMREQLVKLASLKVVRKWGGYFVPASYLATRPMRNLLNDNEVMVGCELKDGIRSSLEWVGSNSPNHPTIVDIENELELIDETNCSMFEHRITNLCDKHIQNGTLSILSPCDIGITYYNKYGDEQDVTLEELLGQQFIYDGDFSDSLHGIYIPQKKLLESVHFGWFSRMSPRQILDGDFLLAKYLTVCQ
jgi:hypothetical protein